MGLQLAKNRNLNELIVLGGYDILIKDLLGLKKSTNQISRGLHIRINSLKIHFDKIHFFHILRSQNQATDCVGKLEKKLSQRQLFIINENLMCRYYNFFSNRHSSFPHFELYLPINIVCMPPFFHHPLPLPHLSPLATSFLLFRCKIPYVTTKSYAESGK